MFFFYFKVCAYPKYNLPPRADRTIVFYMQNTRLYSLKKNRAAHLPRDLHAAIRLR